MILKLSLSVQIMWMIFLKILKNTIRILMLFDVMLCLAVKKLNPVANDLFIRGRKLPFITKSYFAAPKHIKLNSAHYEKSQINKNFNKSHLIIHLISILKAL